MCGVAGLCVCAIVCALVCVGFGICHFAIRSFVCLCVCECVDLRVGVFVRLCAC